MLADTEDFLEARDRIRHVSDFPKPGINYIDLTPLFSDARLFSLVIERMASQWSSAAIDFVVAPESRGFILGAAVALKLGAGFIPVRKPGRLPGKTIHVRYGMEYRSAGEQENILHMHEDAVRRGAKVLIVDDVLASGGTAWAAKILSETLGAHVAGAAFVAEIGALKGREKICELNVSSVLKF